ncbi:extracellular solute-binding protein [Altericista sp. CCNU0014]|uniref:extracellular solute-binding protein n=1 Tax=Altericista sp. CCNU0014 TaxID=3082949 RepID=UPI00384FC4D4
MDRRSFLLSLGTIALSQGLMGCRRNSVSLQVSLLARSLPSQLISKFGANVKESADLKLLLASSPGELFANLQQSADPNAAKSARQPSFFQSIVGGIANSILGSPAKPYPLSSLGDYWLQAAIAQDLIRPWAADRIPGWNTLDPQWQRMVKRDRQGQLAATGQIWGAPYRWGATVIAYRKDKFRALGWTPTDWADLWRPELKTKISLLDNPRETIGLTLKKLNSSYNTQNLEAIPNLALELKALDRQAKFYSSSHYLQPLMLEDTWAAVGWSTDVLPALNDDAELGFAIPQSGTSLWSDIWVLPKTASAEEKLFQQWAEFWWQPEIAKAIAQFTDAVSPVRSDSIPTSPTAPFLERQGWFQNSELLEPIAETTVKQYQSLWQQMRT